MTAKLPFMPFYGADFFESETVRFMDRAERSMYLELLWHQWREGSIPEEPALIARLLGEPAVEESLLAQFPAGPDQRRRNPRLELIRAEQEAVRAKKSEGGKAGRARQLAQRLPQAESGDSPGIPQGVLGQSESESEPEGTTSVSSTKKPADPPAAVESNGAEPPPHTLGSCLGLVVNRLYFGRRPIPSEMATNASILTELHARGYSFERLAHSIEGLADRRNQGDLPKVGTGQAVSCKWLYSKKMTLNQVSVSEDTFYAGPAPPRKRHGANQLGSILREAAKCRPTDK